MHVEFPEFTHHADTLMAVAVGAVLATIGGFVATMIEGHLHRVQREKTAALVVGEMLASLRVFIRAIEDAHGVGDPFGPITLRLLRGARREVDAYERSRLVMSDLRKPQLRLAVHALMIRIALAIDGILDGVTEDDRATAYGYLLVIAPKIDPLVHSLVPLAGQPLSPYDEMTHDPAGRPADAQPAPTSVAAAAARPGA